MKKFLIFTLIFTVTSKGYSTGFSNQIFHENVHSVILKNEKASSNEPILILNSDQQLTLRFDCFDDNVKNYTYTVVHCNPDWSPSDLFANEYLGGFMEENINSYIFSLNTTQKYIHYYTTFPSANFKITKSGNYVVVVNENFDKNNVVFTQKFFVADNQISIVPLPSQAMDNQKRYTHHEINFKINQNLINSSNPRREFNVVVMQNLNYESQLYNIQPTFINGKILSFEGRKLDFEAGNEFRKFDTRTINQNINGLGVHKIVFESSTYHVILKPENSRALESYSLISDFNGERYIQSQKWKSEYSETDYSWVYFYLNSDKDSTSNVYVWGELTNWEKQADAKMKYNSISKQYVGKLFLKQGVYDYCFLTEEPTQKHLEWANFEGSFYQTKNNYYVFVYYQNFSKNYYELIGVKKINYQ